MSDDKTNDLTLAIIAFVMTVLMLYLRAVIAAWALGAFIGLGIPWQAVFGVSMARSLASGLPQNTPKGSESAIGHATGIMFATLLVWLLMYLVAPSEPYDIPAILAAWWAPPVAS